MQVMIPDRGGTHTNVTIKLRSTWTPLPYLAWARAGYSPRRRSYGIIPWQAFAGVRWRFNRSDYKT
eukprot:12890038-Prorocentrum_lima.AAC.1